MNYPTLLISAFSVCPAGCANSSVMDLDVNTIQISTSAAAVCGAQGAQQVASRRAAIETLRQGFDRYVILGGQAENNVRVIGRTPVFANSHTSDSVNTFGNYGTYSGDTTTTFSGGEPIVGGSHDQSLAVRMFASGDPDGSGAIDARRVLGPDWQKAVAKGPGVTC